MTLRILHEGFGALLLAGAFAGSPALADAGYLDRFESSWSGEGFIQREQDDKPRSIRCSLEGSKGSDTEISVAGTCRAAVIFTRRIGADIRYDAASDTFSGSYTGSSRGPAQLSGGKLRGNTVTFKLTYPRIVYGDRNAVMTITNSGNGTLTMSVTDQVDGTPRKTSDVRLTRG